MTVGSIVLIKFPFTDLTSAKRRPALVLQTSNKGDVIVAFISSVIPLQLANTDIYLDNAIATFGLLKPSVLVMDKLATLNTELITGELGYITKEVLQDVKAKLKIVFEL